jgi:two-component system, chemotaxis family, protein-glutamate methylesterase/glutaminase
MQGTWAVSEDVFANRLARPDLARRDDGASGFSCPACHGNLWELREGNLVQYQCRVGHVLSADSLVAEQAVAIEAMLWAALNALQERAALLRRLDRQRGADAGPAATRWQALADAAEHQAELVRQALQGAMQAQG